MKKLAIVWVLVASIMGCGARPVSAVGVGSVRSRSDRYTPSKVAVVEQARSSAARPHCRTGPGQLVGVSQDAETEQRVWPARGKLDPEKIQRVMRSAFPCFRECFEEGLRPCPNLNNRLVVDFIIGQNGWVSSAWSERGELMDREVSDCVISVVQGLTFDPPQGGIVKVSYPIGFTPGE